MLILFLILGKSVMYYYKVDYKSFTNKDKVLIVLFNIIFFVIFFILNWLLLIIIGCIC